MRFLLDEGVSKAAAAALMHLGHDVARAVRIGLTGRDDEEVFARARAEDRILVTRDKHFTNPDHFPHAESPGVIYLHRRRTRVGDEVSFLLRAVKTLPQSSIAGHLVVVDVKKITIDA